LLAIGAEFIQRQRNAALRLMNPLAQQLREEIAAGGPIPFAEFMQRALYDPQHGYYARSLQQIGKRGDFVTSVTVGSFFGELLAFRFARWMEELLQGKTLDLQIVETGAHNGQLAFDILDSLEDREPKLFASLEYWIVEPSIPRRAVQQAMLARFSNVRWFESFEHIRSRITGVIFSNELLDAMPVHVFRWNALSHAWDEMGVAVSGDRLVWTRLGLLETPPPDFPEALLEVLPDGFNFEVSPAALQWCAAAAAALEAGKLLTIDYGATLEELLLPGRTSGTLRSYSAHHLAGDVLGAPGEQDITAHVNFSEIRRAGELAGLKTETFTAQSQFLTEVARELWMRTGSWPAHQVRQFQTLTHPEHLGRPFRVLVQAR
jgi:SAM-dependent MidA family methyltransferase